MTATRIEESKETKMKEKYLSLFEDTKRACYFDSIFGNYFYSR